jgi:hypothetical protein
MTYRLGYLKCRNEACADMIWLNPCSPVPQFQSAGSTDEANAAGIFACGRCSRVFVYRAWEVCRVETSIADPYTRGELVLRFLEFDCEHPHCGARVTVQNPMPVHLREDAERATRESQAWIFSGVHCPKGHEIKRLPEENKCMTSFASERWAHE